MGLVASETRAGKKIVVAGVGGNIGSHFAPHLARLKEIGWIVAIDSDRYESKNLRSQDLAPADVGRWKARVQAKRLRRLAPEIRVDAYAEPIERLPMGLLRADALVSCVDSLATRQRINEICWRISMPWLDGAVDAAGLLARVNVYWPGEGAPCACCPWSEDDYAALPQRHPCQSSGKAPRGVVPTDAPSGLGGVVGGLLAVELSKLLAGRLDRLAVAKEVMLDLAFHRHYVTELRPSPYCRFDHASPGVDRLDRPLAGMTLAEAFALHDAGGIGALSVEGRRLVTRVICTAGHERGILRFDTALDRRPVRCRCGAAMQPSPTGLTDRLIGAEVSAAALRRTLRQIGVRPADVLCVESAAGEARRFELTDRSRAGASAGGGR